MWLSPSAKFAELLLLIVISWKRLSVMETAAGLSTSFVMPPISKIVKLSSAISAKKGRKVNAIFVQ